MIHFPPAWLDLIQRVFRLWFLDFCVQVRIDIGKGWRDV
jgi:hypothetical protein